MYINILCICHILIDVGIWDMMVMLTLCITYYWRWDHTWFEAHFQSIFQKTDDNILYLIIHCEIKKNEPNSKREHVRTHRWFLCINQTHRMTYWAYQLTSSPFVALLSHSIIMIMCLTECHRCLYLSIYLSAWCSGSILLMLFLHASVLDYQAPFLCFIYQPFQWSRYSTMPFLSYNHQRAPWLVLLS